MRANKVAIVCLRWCDLGGWEATVRHLYKSFQLAGVPADIWCIENKRLNYLPVKHLTIESLDKLNDYTAVHVIIPQALKAKDYLLLRGIKRPLFITFHDTSEIKKCKTLIAMLKDKLPAKLIFFRQAMVDHFGRLGLNGVVVPHPYVRDNEAIDYNAKRNIVISTCRVDFDKHNDIFLRAMPKIDGDCYVHTGYIQWLYSRQIGFDKTAPYYQGKFGFTIEERTRVYGTAKILVDLSTIAEDGGGMQYTFLEAMDYGLLPILNADWLKTYDEKVLQTCLFVKDEHELVTEANLMLADDFNYEAYTAENENILNMYNGVEVVKKLLSIYEGGTYV